MMNTISASTWRYLSSLKSAVTSGGGWSVMMEEVNVALGFKKKKKVRHMRSYKTSGHKSHASPTPETSRPIKSPDLIPVCVSSQGKLSVTPWLSISQQRSVLGDSAPPRNKGHGHVGWLLGIP